MGFTRIYDLTFNVKKPTKQKDDRGKSQVISVTDGKEVSAKYVTPKAACFVSKAFYTCPPTTIT